MGRLESRTSEGHSKTGAKIVGDKCCPGTPGSDL